MTELLLCLAPAVQELTQSVLKHCRDHLLCGANSLPNETLSEILWYTRAAQGDDDKIDSPSTSAVTFSHVCRRFRCAAIGNASHWSGVSSAFPPNMAQSFLIRSQSVPLYVHVAGPNTQNRSLFTTLALLASHSRRWKHLFVSNGRHLNILIDANRQLVLPHLEEVRAVGSYAISIPEGWSMPSLLSFKMTNSCLTRSLPDSVVTREVVFQPSTFSPFTVAQMLKNLYLSSSLRHLTLSLSIDSLPTALLEEIPRVWLESLISANISCSGVSHWPAMLDKFEMPRLQKLHCRIESCEGAVLLVLAQALRQNVSLAILQDFQFTYWPARHTPLSDGPGSNSLDEMVEAMESLKSLHFVIRGPPKYLGHDWITSGDGPNPFAQCSSLDDLYLYGAQAPTISYVEGLVRSLRSAPCWARFHTLSIRKPQGLDKTCAAELNDLFEGRKLKWLV